MLLLGATGVVSRLQDALSLHLAVGPSERRTPAHRSKRRIASFAMILGIDSCCWYPLVVSLAISALGVYWEGHTDVVVEGSALVSTVAITVLFALMYKFLPM
jgi:uncharacterized BrkB/YihY/UPF0761 family membrane protein